MTFMSAEKKATIIRSVEERYSIAPFLIVPEAVNAYTEGLCVASLGVPKPSRSKVKDMYKTFDWKEVELFLEAWK